AAPGDAAAVPAHRTPVGSARLPPPGAQASPRPPAGASLAGVRHPEPAPPRGRRPIETRTRPLRPPALAASTLLDPCCCHDVTHIARISSSLLPSHHTGIVHPATPDREPKIVKSLSMRHPLCVVPSRAEICGR